MRALSRWARVQERWSFGGILEYLMLRMLLASPYAVVVGVLGLEKQSWTQKFPWPAPATTPPPAASAAGGKDADAPPAPQAQNPHAGTTVDLVGKAAPVAKTAAATRVLDNACKLSPKLNSIIQGLRLVTDAYLSVGAVPTERSGRNDPKLIRDIVLFRGVRPSTATSQLSSSSTNGASMGGTSASTSPNSLQRSNSIASVAVFSS